LQDKSIISFAHSLLPVKENIQLIKSQHDTEDFGELIHHLKILVKDSAKKLKTSNERQKAKRNIRGEVAETAGKWLSMIILLAPYSQWFPVAPSDLHSQFAHVL